MKPSMVREANDVANYSLEVHNLSRNPTSCSSASSLETVSEVNGECEEVGGGENGGNPQQNNGTAID